MKSVLPFVLALVCACENKTVYVVETSTPPPVVTQYHSEPSEAQKGIDQAVKNIRDKQNANSIPDSGLILGIGRKYVPKTYKQETGLIQDYDYNVSRK